MKPGKVYMKLTLLNTHCEMTEIRVGKWCYLATCNTFVMIYVCNIENCVSINEYIIPVYRTMKQL
jgi:hypothetical protein